MSVAHSTTVSPVTWSHLPQQNFENTDRSATTRQRAEIIQCLIDVYTRECIALAAALRFSGGTATEAAAATASCRDDTPGSYCSAACERWANGLHA